MSPIQLFERARDQWLGRPGPISGEDLADDVVVEWPFAAPGLPSRIEGREAFLAFANPQRAALPFRIDDCTTTAVHETRDPATILVEYTLSGTVLPSGRRAAAGFVAVITAHDGRITRWREYQDTAAMAAALQ